MTKKKPVRTAVAYVISLAVGILLLKRLSQRDYEDTNSGPTTAADEHRTVNRDKIQRDRLERIRNYCSKSRNNQNIFHKLPHRNHFNFVVSEKHKFIICYVPKTGCSQWKDLLLNVLTVRPVTSSHDISLFNHSIFKFLNEYSAEERQKTLNSYQKFYFVREPFERLLSAYRDKFVGKTTQLYERVAKEIIHKVRGVGRDNENGGRPTLAEFTSYLNQLPDPSSWDMHWRPAHQTCYPCAIDYDYVGYFDTIKEDADYILKKLRLDDQFQFPPFRSQTSVMLETHFSQIPLDHIIKLADIYREDFEMFGFKYPASIKKLFKDWV
ncbi:carbohydrate sulfotransferase 14-like [Stylophora pistillata]|uniref:carbohydrate sulfotransferase 14-like n=1 Tax=Stylophora pistillata TaxID=50429 RepID=UPI000C042A5A|nr:carbohydrate sulfotransferase 14-like [Stylophora pistillata]